MLESSVAVMGALMPNAAPAPASPIRPVPPEVSLLTSANPLPAEVASFERWRTGLAARDIHTMTAGLWEVDCVTEATKDDIDTESISEFVPVAIYTHHGCHGRVDEAEYRAEATATLDAKTAYLLAQELWTGAVTGNPSLQSTATDLSAFVGSQSLAVAVSVLLDAFSVETNGLMGTLHVPIGVLHELTVNNLVVRSGNRLETILGHTVIPGPGYPTNTNTAPVGSSEPDPGSFYIYITGPVEVGVGPISVTGTDTFGGTYARQNLVEFYAERQAIYRFPTAPVFATVADILTLPI
jgi:hypothetical protein